jgi:hypothetical protein
VTGEVEVLSEKLVPLPLYPPQIPHGLALIADRPAACAQNSALQCDEHWRASSYARNGFKLGYINVERLWRRKEEKYE